MLKNLVEALVPRPERGWGGWGWGGACSGLFCLLFFRDLKFSFSLFICIGLYVDMNVGVCRGQGVIDSCGCLEPHKSSAKQYMLLIRKSSLQLLRDVKSIYSLL